MCAAVQVLGKAVTLTPTNKYKHMMRTEKVNITVHRYRDSIGQSVHVTTDLYNLLIYATPRQWDEREQQVLRYLLSSLVYQQCVAALLIPPGSKRAFWSMLHI